MSDILHLSLFQTNPVWEDAGANLRYLDKWIDSIDGKCDLIILPEMFLTGFSMDVYKTAQEMNGTGVTWLSSQAKSKRMTIMGSLTIKEDQKYFNRMLVATPDGLISWYDKRHLFRMGEEHLHFSSGEQSLTFNCNEWGIMPLVCYDLRFPVWSRNVNLKYDLLIYVANWPASRKDAFLTLLKARAIENQCYVAAVNRTGTDGNNINYSGDSVIFDPKGIQLTELTDTEKIIRCSLSLAELKKFRDKFPVYLDADHFQIK
jgi:omega-amidase